MAAIHRGLTLTHSPDLALMRLRSESGRKRLHAWSILESSTSAATTAGDSASGSAVAIVTPVPMARSWTEAPDVMTCRWLRPAGEVAPARGAARAARAARRLPVPEGQHGLAPEPVPESPK